MSTDAWWCWLKYSNIKTTVSDFTKNKLTIVVGVEREREGGEEEEEERERERRRFSLK